VERKVIAVILNCAAGIIIAPSPMWSLGYLAGIGLLVVGIFVDSGKSPGFRLLRFIFPYLVGVLAGYLLFGFPASSSSSQESYKRITVPSSQVATGAAQQQLYLRGVRASADAIGVRVFLNPDESEALSPKSKSYMGSVYFSHREEGETRGQNFVLTLAEPVTDEVRIVIYAVSAGGTPVAAKIEVEDAEIKAVDNKAFR